MGERPTGVCRRGCGWFCRWICPGICIIIGVVSLLIGIWSVHLYNRFTPLYTPIVCKVKSFQLKGLSLTIECENPNPYTVNLESVQGGRIFVNDLNRAVATMTVSPSSVLMAHEKGHIVTAFELHSITLTDLLKLFSPFKPITFYIENRLAAHVNIDFLLGHYATTKMLSKDCGLEVLVLTGQRGDLACANDFTKLSVPAIGQGKAFDDDLVMSASMAEDELDEGDETKNRVLIPSMLVGLILGLLFVCIGSVSLVISCARCCKGRSSQEHEKNFEMGTTQDLPADEIIGKRGTEV